MVLTTHFSGDGYIIYGIGSIVNVKSCRNMRQIVADKQRRRRRQKKIPAKHIGCGERKNRPGKSVYFTFSTDMSVKSAEPEQRVRLK